MEVNENITECYKCQDYEQLHTISETPYPTRALLLAERTVGLLLRLCLRLRVPAELVEGVFDRPLPSFRPHQVREFLHKRKVIGEIVSPRTYAESHSTGPQP